MRIIMAAISSRNMQMKKGMAIMKNSITVDFHRELTRD
jgi:hypothetical protein